MAKLASSKDSDLVGVVPIEEFEQPTIDGTSEVLTIQTVENWMTPLIQYLMSAELPNDWDEARRIRYSATWYLYTMVCYIGKAYRHLCSGA